MKSRNFKSDVKLWADSDYFIINNTENFSSYDLACSRYDELDSNNKYANLASKKSGNPCSKTIKNNFNTLINS